MKDTGSVTGTTFVVNLGIGIKMKKIALINDLSGFGKCSLTAAIPVVSVMGIQACPYPTAILSSQTGFSDFYCDDFTDRMDYFTKEWEKISTDFDGICSGYLAGPEQIEKVLHFLDVFQSENTIFLVDPVLGDNGECIKIYTDELLHGMQTLCRQATICTPNLTELCLLTGTSYETLISFSDKADFLQRIHDTALLLLNHSASLKTVLITGILRRHGNQTFIGNLAVSSADCQKDFYYETPYTGSGFSGTGDLFAAVVCASLVQGLSVKEAVTKAVDFLQPAIEEATAEHIPSCHGINFEKYLYRLL